MLVDFSIPLDETNVHNISDIGYDDIDDIIFKLIHNSFQMSDRLSAISNE